MKYCMSTISNMSGRVVSDVQTRAEDVKLSISHNCDIPDDIERLWKMGWYFSVLKCFLSCKNPQHH